MIVGNGVEVILQLNNVLSLWTHLFVAEAKVLRTFRQPLFVPSASSNMTGSGSSLTAAWRGVEAGGCEPPVAGSSRRSAETLEPTLSNERRCCACFLVIDCAHALGRAHALSSSSRRSVTKPKRHGVVVSGKTVSTIWECGDD